MTPFDRQVRAQIYRLLVNGSKHVGSHSLAASRGWDPDEVAAALRRLDSEHRIALMPETDRVWMAHPFSGVETAHSSSVGDRSWFANCAWDALAILALMGDGTARSGDTAWEVRRGVVEPNHVIHLQVPVRRFWEDIGFT